MNSNTLFIAKHAGVLTLTLHRPEQRNALTPELLDELIAALEAARDDTDVGVVVLAGTGEAFCAGFDIAHLESLGSSSVKMLHEEMERAARLFRNLYELPQPTIAAVHGAAVAAGAGLAMVCDFTLASPGVKFGFTEVRFGIVPAVLSAFLTLAVGDKLARSLLLTGRLFTAEQAFAWGLVSEIVASPDLSHRTRELAATLLSNSPNAMAATKRLLAAQNQPWLEAALAAALEASRDPRVHADRAEGVAAFQERRNPQWLCGG